ncbi:MAG: hypothetical protein IPN23_11220 [Elusimicrobia bacterium]|nr:hypothetical protein [Elusimicrobiota bacterium]
MKIPAGWGKDFLVAAGVVAAAAAVLGAHGLGTRAGAGWAFLGVTGLAVLSTVLFRGAHAGRGPDAGDVFGTRCLGLTVVLSSAQGLWQSPTGWAGVFLESRVASAVTVGIYIAVTAIAWPPTGARPAGWFGGNRGSPRSSGSFSLWKTPIAPGRGRPFDRRGRFGVALGLGIVGPAGLGVPLQ